MNNYELLFIISTQATDEKREELIARFSDLITAKGGEVEVVKLGVKKLAYPIKFRNDGYYVQFNFSAPQELIVEIERQMRLLDLIVRFMTVKKVVNKHTIKADARREAQRKARAEKQAAEKALEDAQNAEVSEEAKIFEEEVASIPETVVAEEVVTSEEN